MVDDIVVKEAGRVDEFYDRGKRETPLPAVAAQVRRHQQEERTEPFAAAADEVVRYFRYKGDLGIKI
jgi:hypothetical protein